MSEATLPLQAAVVAALKAYAPLTALVGASYGGGVYDIVPQQATPPYVMLSGWQEVEDGSDCFDASEVFFDAQCFGNDDNNVGRVRTAQIASAVKAALHRLTPATAGWGNTEIIYRSTQYFVESDNVTTRAVLNFQTLTDSDT